MVIDVGECKLQHFKHELVALVDQIAFNLFESVQARGIHMCQCVNVMCSTQLRVHLHYQLSLALQLLPVYLVLPLEVPASFISLLRLLDLVHALLNDLVLEHDALLELLLRLR